MENTKLTLSVDKDTIQMAKEIAADDHISVSKLFKALITELAKKRKKKEFKMKSLDELSDWAREIVVATEPTPDFDHKAEYYKHLEEKYGL